MTGPEHYAEAESQLKWVEEAQEVTATEYATAIGLAQAHATLALVAAIAESGGLTGADETFGIPHYPSWIKAVRPS